MTKTLSFTGALFALAATAALPTTADAQRYRGHGYARDYRGYDHGYDRRDYGYRGEGRRCDSGTTGTIIGAIAGGLLGRTIDTRGDRTLGTVLGGAGGALAGHAIGTSNNPRYCR